MIVDIGIMIMRSGVNHVDMFGRDIQIGSFIVLNDWYSISSLKLCKVISMSKK